MGNVWLIDSDCSRHMTGDQRWFSSLTPVSTREYITFGDKGRGRVIAVGEVKVSDSVMLKRVALVKSLVFNLLSVSQLLDEGFEVWFKLGASRVLDSRGDLVCMVIPRVRFFGLISLELLVLLVAWWQVLLWSFGNGIGGWDT